MNAMRVRWPTVFFVVLGAGRAASAQPTAPAPQTATPAVAAFPDVVPEPKKPAATDPVTELLGEDPYADVLTAIHVRENLYGAAIDDEDPYADQMKLMNPYTEELRHRMRVVAAPLMTDLDTNPYTRR